MKDKRIISSGVDVTDDGELYESPCPSCNEQTVMCYPWWDDPPENGGVCIGELLICLNCSWEDTQ